MWGSKRGSGEAEGAGGGGESAHRCGEAIVGGVGEGEQAEQEEEYPHQVGGEDGEAVGVLHCRGDSRETHVVTEGVAEHRAHQVTCSREETFTSNDVIICCAFFSSSSSKVLIEAATGIVTLYCHLVLLSKSFMGHVL